MLEGRVLVSNCYESLSKSSFQIGLLFSDVFIYLHFQPLADQSQPPDQNRQKSVRRKMLRHLSKRCPIRRQLERAWCVELVGDSDGEMRPHTGLGVSPGPVSRHHVAQWEETEGRFSVLSLVHTCKMLGSLSILRIILNDLKAGKQ